MAGNRTKILPDSLLWLADSPLLIDSDFLSQFYDAVVRPEARKGVTTLEISEETVTSLKAAGTIGAEVSLEANDVLSAISSFFPFIKPKLAVTGNVDGEGTRETTSGATRTIDLHPIDTPQRQLVQLTLHYLLNNPDRLMDVTDPSEADWRSDTFIRGVPRPLVFIDLPGEREAGESGRPATKIIPMAAEFADGKVVPLYPKLRRPNGEMPPAYPHYADRAENGTYDGHPDLQSARKEYWKWFDRSFRAIQAVEIVEEAAFQHGRIRWIDYRVPISEDGGTLHLHMRPQEKYDTGDLAYNMIKRGLRHGLRLVGTLKSEPDLNVLAVYER
jgi:hypothetical protein